MPDHFLTTRIRAFLEDRMDQVGDVAEAHAMAQTETSHGCEVGGAAQEFDVLLEALAAELAHALTGIPGQRAA